MKRDIDLIRTILLSMEANEHGFAGTSPAIEGHSEEQIGYHVYLMGQAGLITTADATCLSDQSPNAIPLSITWAGHDFLDSVKDETLWKKAKTIVLKPAAGVAFDVLVEWVKAEAKQRLGLP